MLIIASRGVRPARDAPGHARSDERDTKGDLIEHICFDAERAILAGNVGQETKNEILRTTDGGLTWMHVPLGVPHGLPVRVDAAQVFADGHAWLLGSTGVLASQDFGATWHYLAGEPFEGAALCSSLCFRTPELGVVGARGNGLNLTTDGGRTWTWLKTPVDELLPAEAHADEDRDLAVMGVWFLGERLLVLQRRRLFQHDPSAEGAWSAVDLAGHAVVAAEQAPDGLVVVTDDLRVSVLSESLELSSACDQALDSYPFAIATGVRGVAFLTDARGRVCTLQNDELECSGLYTRGDERTWPIGAFDRTADGTLFGTTDSSLYRSTDSGRSWERLAEGRFFGGVFASADGSHVLIFERGGGLRTWHDGGQGITPAWIADGPLRDLTIRARKRDLWIATTFEAAPDEETQRKLHTSDITLVGPEFKALVFASPDEGLTWTKIDEYAGAIVHAAWLGNDDVLSLCLSDQTIWSGRLEPLSGVPVRGELDILGPAQRGLGGQWGSWLVFPDESTGWVGGNKFIGGEGYLHRSFDGGRTWIPVEPPSDALIQAFRLGDGSCVRTVRPWGEGSRVEIWRAGEFQEIRRFESRVHDVRVDASGCLLVRLESAEVWRLAADGGEWTRLGTIQIPPR